MGTVERFKKDKQIKDAAKSIVKSLLKQPHSTTKKKRTVFVLLRRADFSVLKPTVTRHNHVDVFLS